MRLNQSVCYGVACLFELSKYPGEYMESEALAQTLNIPPAYAHKVLQAMAKAGLIFGLKGSGYRLLRPLAHISALEVVEALTKETTHATDGTDVSAIIQKRINEALGRFTLDELNVLA